MTPNPTQDINLIASLKAIKATREMLRDGGAFDLSRQRLVARLDLFLDAFSKAPGEVRASSALLVDAFKDFAKITRQVGEIMRRGIASFEE